MFQWVAVLGLIVLTSVIQNASAFGKSQIQLPSSVFTATGVPAKPVIAHRGASGLAPEETKPAFLLARELGVDYLEADLHRTKDKVIVAIHDEDLARTSNVKKVFPNATSTLVGDFTHAELLQLDFGTWYNDKNKAKARATYKGLKILTLEELIDIAEGGTNKPGLYLETKAPELYPGIEKDIVDVLDKRGWLKPDTTTVPATSAITTGLGAGRVIFQSFDIVSLAQFKVHAPNVPRVYLTPVGTAFSDTIRVATLGDVHGIGPFALSGTATNIDEAHKNNFIVHPYVLNTELQMNTADKNGADGFFTDNCEVDLIRRGRIKATDVAATFKKIAY